MANEQNTIKGLKGEKHFILTGFPVGVALA